jgi:formylmethanofuran--tetrahydromethanopterin N-formyltransferase
VGRFKMKVNGVKIDDTYAEAFPVYVARVLITGATTALAETAAIVATGFATSVIGCSAEAGIDRYVQPSETPDGRPGVIIMVVHPSKKQIKSNLIERIGECVLTAATTAVFNALESEETVPVKLHFFGDGYEYQTTVGGRSVWAIPILEGESSSVKRPTACKRVLPGAISLSTARRKVRRSWPLKLQLEQSNLLKGR